MKKNKIVEGPTIAESYKPKNEDLYICKQWIKAAVIDAPAYVRGPKYIPPQDPFLAYLEWKTSLPWYKRWGLP